MYSRSLFGVIPADCTRSRPAQVSRSLLRVQQVSFACTAGLFWMYSRSLFVVIPADCTRGRPAHPDRLYRMCSLVRLYRMCSLARS